jgi:DNA-binding transcriptional LysR family regulator
METVSAARQPRRAELGLLTVLVAVADTGTVSAAAERLSLSQPTVSHALNRLRDIVGDRLFEKNSRRMVPTSVAAFMIDDARRIIEAADNLLMSRGLGRGSGAASWRIGASDYALLAIGVPLLGRLKSISPGAKVDFRPVGAQTLDDLLSERIDFAFWSEAADLPIVPHVIRHEIFREKYIGLMCRTHPLAQQVRAGSISLDDWLGCRHLRFASGTAQASSIDRALEKIGRQRIIEHPAAGQGTDLDIIRNSTWLVSLPERLRYLVDDARFVSFALPVPVPPFACTLLYHARVQSDPALKFMTDLILEVAQGSTLPPEAPRQLRTGS